MSEHHDPEEVWDEYDWERFLQQQDRKTEQYMELLEKYIDDPERDQIIAREMGWAPFVIEEEEDEEGNRWLEISFSVGDDDDDDLLSSFGEDDHDDEDEDSDERNANANDSDDGEPFELHPLYQASFALTVWIDQLFDDLGEVQNRPAAIRMATHCSMASAKLAAALSDDDAEELGMTIAYLKRALKAITIALDASHTFAREARLSQRRRKQLHSRLFQVRDGIITLMGECRREWRKRFGAEE